MNQPRPTFRGGDEPNPNISPYCIDGISFVTFPPSPAFGERVIAVAESLPAKAPSDQDNATPSIADLIHPEYNRWSYEWFLWRSAYEGGRQFVHAYLSQFSNREDAGDFEKRKRVTPVSAFAKAGINDIKNQVVKRITATVRRGGPESYLSACRGQNGGVDLKGSTMEWFIQSEILPELLVMGKFAVFVDAPPAQDFNLPIPPENHPYLYKYTREHIRNWSYNETGKLTQILLRDYVEVVEPTTRLPIGTEARFRFLWLTPDNQVGVAIFDSAGQYSTHTILNIPEIPVRIYQLPHSLMADVANHQVALMNMESSDVASALKAGFAIYIEQRDARYESSHLKQSNLPPEVRSAVSETLESDIRGHDYDAEEVPVGPSHGRYYGVGMNPPAFITPPTDPIKASMAKQQALKEDIRILLNLSLANMATPNVSADAKALEQEGTEAGFNAIARELEHGESLIAKSWAQYVGSKEVTTIIYPDQYVQESDDDRISRASKLSTFASSIPSEKYRKAVQVEVARILLQGKIDEDSLNQIVREIQASKYPTSDPAIIQTDVQTGLVSAATGSLARGYDPSEAKTAAQEHLTRVAAIASAQAPKRDPTKLTNAADRGVKDLAGQITDQGQEQGNVTN